MPQCQIRYRNGVRCKEQTEGKLIAIGPRDVFTNAQPEYRCCEYHFEQYLKDAKPLIDDHEAGLEAMLK